MSAKIMIYGAQSIALGAALAVQALYPECRLIGFLVSSLENNPVRLADLPVIELHSLKEKDIHVLIATPEDTHAAIIKLLHEHGITSYTCLDWEKEETLMKEYYERKGKFPAIQCSQKQEYIAEVYMAKFNKDKPLKTDGGIPDWLIPIQVGAALTDQKVADIRDDSGENISKKNRNYCELTALYWIWKNRLNAPDCAAYSGVFHYRRFLNLSDRDMEQMKQEGVDVVLPFPTVHGPDISEHHARYIKEMDWEAMRQALYELQPQYAERLQGILKQPYLYNYNIIVAKKEVLKGYCEWLFPILERTEELSNPKGWERADRYIGYLGENLLTLYFLSQKELKIRHVGRKMLV